MNLFKFIHQKQTQIRELTIQVFYLKNYSRKKEIIKLSTPELNNFDGQSSLILNQIDQM